MHSKQCSKQWPPVNEPPWLNLKTRRIVNLLLRSYLIGFNQSLIKCPSLDDSYRLISQTLFAVANPVIAHSAQKNPCLIYANAAALRLWCRRWHQMVGMPSALTATSNEQQSRQLILSQAMQKGAIKGYQGVRIDSQGREFRINNVRLWTIWDENERVIGQAATFSSWWHL